MNGSSVTVSIFYGCSEDETTLMGLNEQLPLDTNLTRFHIVGKHSNCVPDDFINSSVKRRNIAHLQRSIFGFVSISFHLVRNLFAW